MTIDELTTVTFLKNGKNMVYAKTVDVFGERNGGRKSYIGANEIRRIQIRNLADQQMIGAGWLIRGTDDNGNEVCFRAYFPFETMYAGTPICAGACFSRLKLNYHMLKMDASPNTAGGIRFCYG